MQKKNMEKKSGPCPQPGLSPDLAHGSELFVFLFFWVFSRFWPNCEKPWKNQKKQKVQTHVPSQASPQTLPMGLNFFFVFLVFSRFWPNCKKPWKNKKNTKKTKSSDPCPQPGLSPDLAHGSELGRGLAGDMGLNFLFFLVFPWFFAVWPKPRENPKKQKNKKFRPMGKVWGEAWLGTWV